MAGMVPWPRGLRGSAHYSLVRRTLCLGEGGVGHGLPYAARFVAMGAALRVMHRWDHYGAALQTEAALRWGVYATAALDVTSPLEGHLRDRRSRQTTALWEWSVQMA